MLKAAGAVLVIFACTALGYSQSLTFQKRLGCLEEIRKMTILLLGEITYRREALPQAMERVSGKVGAPFCDFLKKYRRKQEAVRESGFPRFLPEEQNLF